MLSIMMASKSAYPHSSLNWQPNDEEIENFQKHTYRSINNQRNTIMPT